MRVVFVLPTVFFCPPRPRISAGGASGLGGRRGLGNWLGSRLQTVSRSIGIGTEGSKYWASFPRLDPPGWGCRHWTLGGGRWATTVGLVHLAWGVGFDPSINTHGVGTYNTADIALSLGVCRSRTKSS